MGALEEGSEMMTLCLHLSRGSEDTSRVHDILSTSITSFDGSVIPLLEDDGLPINNKFPILSLDYTIKFAMCRVILEHVDHVVEVKCRAEGSPGNQVPNMVKSVHTNLHHLVRASTAQDAAVPGTGRSRQPLSILYHM